MKEIKRGRNVNSKILEHVNEVVYLGSMFSRNGRHEMDAERLIAAGNRVNGAFTALTRRRNVSTSTRLALHNSVLVTTLLYGSETWVLDKKKKERKMNAVEMRISMQRNETHRMAGTSKDVT